MKHKWLVLMLLLLTLCGCQSPHGDEPVTDVTDAANGAPTQMTQSLEEPEASQMSQTLETEAAEGTTGLSASQLALFQTFFDDPTGWYARALTSRYAQAQDVDLHRMFYCGAGDIGPSGPELEYLRTQWETEQMELDVMRSDKSAMDDALETVFHRSLVETNGVGLEYMTEYNGAYFHACGDVLISIVTLERGDWLNEDTVALYYTSDEPDVGLCRVTMQRWDDRWVINSNEAVE